MIVNITNLKKQKVLDIHKNPKLVEKLQTHMKNSYNTKVRVRNKCNKDSSF